MIAQFSLRTRLLISYIFLLVFTLVVMSIVLIVFFSARPAPIEPTFDNIANTIKNIDMSPFLDDRQELSFPIRQYEEITPALDEIADDRNVRVLWLVEADGYDIVWYDTAQVFTSGTRITLQRESFINANLEARLKPQMRQVYGLLRDPNGVEWLYGGIVRDGGRLRGTMSSLVIAEPRPTLSLREVLTQFSGSIVPPIIQGSVVGILLAIAMAALISRSFVRPLQNLLTGVLAVTKGNYEQTVPEEGAPEVRELAQAFNVMSSEVRQSQQSQRDFLANVSHDLKTPLTSIQGYSQAIIDGAMKDPAQAAKIIHEEAGRLNRLVVELTDLIRMQAGRLSLKMTGLDLNAIVTPISERLAMVASKKQVELIVETADLPIIAGDGDRLAQVLTNLLSNAIKFTPTGGKVYVRTQSVRGGVELIVRDSGIGIPTEDLPRIFERFYQVDKARGPQRGTGLGLAITQEIVHAHGGKIMVYSAGANKGTTFTIYLPIPDLSTVISRRG
jgi:signal transduction histidine kinase